MKNKNICAQWAHKYISWDLQKWKNVYSILETACIKIINPLLKRKKK